MNRRNFLALTAAATLAAPLRPFAQQPRIKLVGYIDILPADDPQSKVHLDAFWQAVGKHGWDPQSLAMQYRWGANTPEKSHQPALELIGGYPDLIFAVATNNLAELAQDTTTIPVVFSFVGGAVADALIKNYSRPEGNLTGFVNYPNNDVRGKVVQLLTEVAPNLDRIGFIYNPDAQPDASITDAAGYVKTFSDPAANLGKPFVALAVRTTAEVTNAVQSFAAEGFGGLVMSGDSWMVSNRAAAIDAVAERRLPTVWQQIVFATDGGMIAYAVDAATIVRAAADYAGLILNGTRVAELPVQQAPLQLTVNLKTANALGIAIPQSVLYSADQVIT